MISFDFSKPSILRSMFLAFMAFGFSMGVIFPIFANLFVEWKEGMLIWFIVSCIVAGISIGLFNFWLLNKMLLQRLKRIAEVANAISQNDVSHDCSLVSNDFIGDIATSFNLMSSNLRTMIKRISDVSIELNSASDEMVLETKQTQQAVEQQKRETESVAMTIGNMNQTVLEMSDHTQAAMNSVDEANSATEKGTLVVNSTVASISQLAQQVEESAEVIRRLGKDSETIGSVLGVIKHIAEQTNLLALNAAIEAARAGEHGRGFAVVADEVRVLASSTQKATKQIEETIESLQAASKEAVSAMDQGRKKAHQTEQQANEAGCSLDSIERAVSTIAQMNANIKSASDMQRQQAQLVNSSVENISSVAQNVASGADSTLATSTNVGAIASQLSKLIGQFRT